MRVMGMGLLALLFCLPVAAGEIRLASWNLNNLHWQSGEPLRSRAPVRADADYHRLRDYARRLDADVVALQEVNGPRAARRVFPPSEYRLFFSGRLAEDRRTGRESDRIYTGFAVRRGVFDRVEKRDYPALGLAHGRGLRWGTELRLFRDGDELAVLAVHLKSGCFARSLEPADDPACRTLAAQRRPLEAWIDARAEAGMAFAVLGDFNRAFDIFGDRDHVWEAIDDGSPEGLDLWRLPYHRESRCWAGTGRHHRHPIDFLVFDDRAWQRVDRDSFRQLTFDPDHRDIARGTPSDHCPIVVEIDG